MIVRREAPSDVGAIAEVTAAAFRNAPHSDGREGAIVDGLRGSGALALSLVVEREGAVVGHAAFSPVLVEAADLGWFGLGPVSVLPNLQRQGFGSALIARGLAELRGAGAGGCVVLGEPRYYGRFGFRHEPSLTYRSLGPYFQATAFAGRVPSGEVRYAAPFG